MGNCDKPKYKDRGLLMNFDMIIALVYLNSQKKGNFFPVDFKQNHAVVLVVTYHKVITKSYYN
jgi:hypothetical protein